MAWLTNSDPAYNEIQFDVATADMGLAGSTVTVSVTLVPDFADGDGYPPTSVYSFDVVFSYSCSVTSISFTTVTTDQNYFVGQGALASNTYTVVQSPQTCYTPSISFTSAPDASNIVTLDQNASNFSIETLNLADVGAYTISVTAEVTLLGTPGVGTLSDTFAFTVQV